MANEAVPLVNPTRSFSYTVADGTTIEKGTVLKVADPNTASAATTNTALSDSFAGIATSEKVASDGQLTIDAARDGIWDMRASGVITAGKYVKSAGNNYVMQAVAADFGSGVIIGQALETSSDGEVIEIHVRPSG